MNLSPLFRPWWRVLCFAYVLAFIAAICWGCVLLIGWKQFLLSLVVPVGLIFAVWLLTFSIAHVVKTLMEVFNAKS